MSKTIVMYQSKYGATKKYAHWLAEELSCEIVETKKANAEDMEQYDTIILGGGIYASGISGLSFIRKNYTRLKDKKLIVFAVGASPYDEKAMLAIKEHNLKGELATIPFFYARGAWNEDKMSWKDRTLCGMLKKFVAKKDPANYEPWESALMQAFGTNCDWTEKKELGPILDYFE